MIDAWRIGVTGTRKEPTIAQYDWLNHRLRGIGMTEFHFGCCDGADTMAFMIALSYFEGWQPEEGQLAQPIIGHPPVNQKHMMTLLEHPLVRYEDPKPYLPRNDDIVEATQRIIAVPDGYAPREHSGTWYTIDQALWRGRCVEVVYPNGTSEVMTP